MTVVFIKAVLDVRLSQTLLREYFLGTYSNWHAYIATLSQVVLPTMFVTDSDMIHLEGTLSHGAFDIERRRYQSWVETLCRDRPEDVKDCHWVVTAVGSRRFLFEGQAWMLPLVDMSNYPTGNDTGNAELHFAHSKLGFKAVKPIPVGTEITYRYQ